MNATDANMTMNAADMQRRRRERDEHVDQQRDVMSASLTEALAF